MKNTVLVCLAVLNVFAMTACESKNTAQAQTATESRNVVVKSAFDVENLEKTEYIAETQNSFIGRYIDCAAGVTIYTHGSAISVMPNAQISQKLIEEKCK